MENCGCPGSNMMDLRESNEKNNEETIGSVKSELRQWPVQMHLISPTAPYFEKADVLLAADCVPFAMGEFHSKFLNGKSLGIACPKLDSNQEIYMDKIKSWIDDAKINTLTVITMQVPCCMGLVALAQQALSQAERKIPAKHIVIGMQGEILQDEWIVAQPAEV